jgi:hypothetical protein
LCLLEAFLGFIEEPIYTALGQGQDPRRELLFWWLQSG